MNESLIMRATRIPTVPIGCVDVPVVSLGDRGFLSAYGSQLSDVEISDRMRFAHSQIGCGLATGDHRTLRLASEIASNREATVIYHVPHIVQLRGSRFCRERILATLHEYVKGWSKEFVENDTIVGHQYAACKGFIPLYADAASLCIDSDAIGRELSLIQMYQPRLVTVGGDWLDCCMLLQRQDLVADVLTLFASATHKYNGTLVVLSYCPALSCVGQRIFANVQALMMPVNVSGNGMIPTRAEALSWARKEQLHVVGIHGLASGTIDVQAALSDFRDIASCCIVGASRMDHITSLVACAKRLWSDSCNG